MLVLLDSPYIERVLVVVGTLHIDMIKLATQEEMDCLGHFWKRGAGATKIAKCQV